MIELIVGGARSGKSMLAEQRAKASGLSVTYIATGEPGDEEMAQRIFHHQQRRPAHWRVMEEPLHLGALLCREASADRFILVDCLTLWLTNLLCKGKAMAQTEAGEVVDCALLKDEMTALLDSLPHLPGHILLVSNEVGMGVVPWGAINRLFVDEQGRLNQRVAQLADRVTLVTAGLPLELKKF